MDIRSPIEIEVLNNKVYLDTNCWSCNTSSWKRSTPTNTGLVDENGVCTICGGIGYIPTETGKSILNLIERHINKNKET
jgi:hypothetical protein